MALTRLDITGPDNMKRWQLLGATLAAPSLDPRMPFAAALVLVYVIRVVQLQSTPIYNGNDLAPIGIQPEAFGNKGFCLMVCIPNAVSRYK